MNKKNRTIIILIIAVAIATSIYAYEQMASTPPELSRNVTTTINTARYIMFGGNYEVVQNDNTAKLESGVFKLDTYTGKAWKLKVTFFDGKKNQKWIPVFHEKELKEKTKISHSPIRGLPTD
jgi:hypothetical protein